MDFLARLIDEHQDCVLQLMKLAEAIEGIRINGRGEYFMETVDDLWKPLTLDLDDHAAREEEFLFPRLAQRVPESPVPVMLAEHAEIRDRSAVFGQWYPLWRAGDESAYPQWSAAALGPAREIHDPHSKGKFGVFVFRD